MAITMLRGVGFEIQDMGVSVSTEKIIELVWKHKSALLTTTMPEMRRIIDALKARGLQNIVQGIVGSAPVNEKCARDIGASGYGADTGESADLAMKLMKDNICPCCLNFLFIQETAQAAPCQTP